MDKLSHVRRIVPSPTDFDEYLKWACRQLAVDANIITTKIYLTEYVSVTRLRSKMKTKIKHKVEIEQEGESSKDLSFSDIAATPFSMYTMQDNVIHVETFYDNNLRLIKIKLNKNRVIPREVMKIIGLIIPFHPKLTSIVINSGLQMEGIYEISKFLHLSHVTELCLDYTYVAAANYHVLLGQNALKYLSLAKCNINDVVVQTIATKLVFNNSLAATTLSILNLSTNRITDVGAKYLADALRSNRHLSFLNLAGNMISDTGAIKIFECFGRFSVTDTELKHKKIRYLAYLKQKEELIRKTIKGLKTAGDFTHKVTRRKSIKSSSAPPSKPLGAPNVAKMKKGDESKFLPSEEDILYERAENMASSSILGPFDDPFGPRNTEFSNGTVHCYGNNTLCYLNLAFNNLTYLSIKKLYEVLKMQTLLHRKPRGLIKVVIEGNYLSNTCKELRMIDYILDASINNDKKASENMKKRRHSIKPDL